MLELRSELGVARSDGVRHGQRQELKSKNTTAPLFGDRGRLKEGETQGPLGKRTRN